MSLIVIAPNQSPIKHINSIAHEGKIVGFGTDAAGNVWYFVKQDGFEDSSLNQTTLIPGWENPKQLNFSDQPDDPSVIGKETAELTYPADASKFLLRSRYQTQNDTAVAGVGWFRRLGIFMCFANPETIRFLLIDMSWTE